MLHPTHTLPLWSPNKIWRSTQTMKLLIIQSSPVSCHFLPLRPKHFPRHLTLALCCYSVLNSNPRHDHWSYTQLPLQTKLHGSWWLQNCFTNLTRVNARQTDAIYNKFYISGNIITLRKFLSLRYGCVFWSNWHLKPAKPCPGSIRAEWGASSTGTIRCACLHRRDKWWCLTGEPLQNCSWFGYVK